MIVAIEDALSAAVAQRIVAHSCPSTSATTPIGGTGYGYLKTRAPGLNRAAKGSPIFMLTDLDDPKRCPADLVTDWLQGVPRHPNFALRVAVVEVEAWLLADRERFAHFLRVSRKRVPLAPEKVPQPKELVINLARKSASRQIQTDLVPAKGSTAKIGPAYNPRLISFVDSSWDLDSAAAASDSLSRTIERVRALCGGS